jgi:hypothetical protein
MSNDKIKKKILKIKSNWVNLTNSRPEIWGKDNPTKTKVEQIMKLKS